MGWPFPNIRILDPDTWGTHMKCSQPKNLKNVNSLRITGARLLCRYSTHHGCRRLWSSDGSDDFAAVLRWANGTNNRKVWRFGWWDAIHAAFGFFFVPTKIGSEHHHGTKAGTNRLTFDGDFFFFKVKRIKSRKEAGHVRKFYKICQQKILMSVRLLWISWTILSFSSRLINWPILKRQQTCDKIKPCKETTLEELPGSIKLFCISVLTTYHPNCGSLKKQFGEKWVPTPIKHPQIKFMKQNFWRKEKASRGKYFKVLVV